MSSPTSTPRVSRAAFQVRPKSLRLILVVAERPMRRLPQGSLARPAQTLDGEGHGHGDAVQGQVARYFVIGFAQRLDLGGFEGHNGKLLNVKEVGALQVSVALRIAGIQTAYVNRCFHAGEGGAALVQAQDARKPAEVAFSSSSARRP